MGGGAPRPVKVLYVAGLGRSGSTILANTLGQVEGFFSGGELNFIWKHALIENRLCGCGKPSGECEFWGPVFDGEFGGQRFALAAELCVEDRSPELTFLRRLATAAKPIFDQGMLPDEVQLAP